MSEALRAGYKLTEVGVIPEDWEDLTVGAAIEFQGGSQPEKSVFSTQPRPGFVRLIQIRDYKSDRFEVFAPIVLLRRFCDENDIMIGRYGPPVFQILRGLSGAYNVALIKAIPCPDIDREFAFYFLKQDSLFEFIDKLSRRSSGQTGVDLSELRQYPLPLPPLPEQRAIAAALSDIDTLLTKLDTLIAKKRNIKQATMQQLLTGQIRLPGFSGEWEAKSFVEIFDYLPTATNARSDLSDVGDTYYVHYGDIHTRFHSHLDFRNQLPSMIWIKRCRNAALLKNGDWVMADASEDYDGIGKSIEISGIPDGVTAVAGLHTFLLREKKPTFAAGYKGHLGNLKSLHQQYLKVATGMKVFGVSKKALSNLTIQIPSIKEQAAISSILSDIDTELATLESRRDKTQAIKQGMMQELLTGRIRLI